ncbi:hypothetical protein [Azospirillum rugosum]|uniref:Uncharacterized protein n=1 Tax=Azospirillum rugosum TaxID=416170 RepID=A0ABS4SH90_9PROT|nr:hypothetical protein [Azospirillum rugosum]MBP2291948.1 hypothetical protein [Azospirillum rugosum]MDQ0525916.1 hypothetical protein [Azospirillum rugosum]
MDAELKTILTVLLDKVERIETTTLETRADVVRLEQRMGRFEDEQRQMKEMLGIVRMREIGRLDGRIDQLTLDVGLGRQSTANQPAAE